MSEIYSPVRVAKVAEAMGLRRGLSMDILTGWNFNESDSRRRAWKHVKEDEPLLLIGSPMCTMFSHIQNLNWGRSVMGDQAMWARLQVAINHMEFVCQLYEEQHRRGRYFLHEHPMTASSWELACIRRLAAKIGVYIVRSDLCQFGLTSKDAQGEAPAKKPTYFMTDSATIAKLVTRRLAKLVTRRLAKLVTGKLAKLVTRR